ncbi:MAG: twin-arginine translocase TatA/TatE family subunit [Chloroflexi bacterium]|nr:twin-arginine translocase TatA/TatE family subunit [Chloroflexota bacterium]
MFGLGPTEIIIIAVVIIILFGVGKISRLGGELGSAIREFRKGISPKEDEKKEEEEADK